MLEELIIRSLADTCPSEPADAVFLFGQTKDNQQSVFETAKTLLHEKQVMKVLFLSSEPKSGYPGFDKWQQELVQIGVQPQQIEPVPSPDTEILHTRIEADAMVKHALKQKYKSIIIAASPFQQPRALMAAVTAALAHYPTLYLYSKPGKPLPWCQEANHSQGKVEDTRAGLISGEIERIHKYNQKGDLAYAKDVLEYLNRRDRHQL
ncbi:YdcF family protein [Pontibacter rugosus]|uniref:YdcF family protein n=1 Tax=Pontibacter rugosus TaxID=1745966 RepID=A0ABW3SS35_9BACT